MDAHGKTVPAGEEGRLQVRGPFLFVGYAERLEMTRALFDGEWFDTGDLAHVDAEGYLSISGRTKDVIIRGGENIPVAYVENVLYEHPQIQEVAVVGLPDPRLQERACACVVPVAGAELTWLAGAHRDEKGAGICHGTAGNGYALLAAFDRTGDELWLDRARRFAVHALAQAEREPPLYGLWIGAIGAAVFASDCLDGRSRCPFLG